jgi:hypothetical protein
LTSYSQWYGELSNNCLKFHELSSGDGGVPSITGDSPYCVRVPVTSPKPLGVTWVIPRHTYHSRGEFINPAISGKQALLYLGNPIQLKLVCLCPDEFKFVLVTLKESVPVPLRTKWAFLHRLFLLAGLLPQDLLPAIWNGVEDNISVGEACSIRLV